jgi:hypothetical protein
MRKIISTKGSFEDGFLVEAENIGHNEGHKLDEKKSARILYSNSMKRTKPLNQENR